ncbi:amino acid transporter [Kaistia dalseonensis]|uniref:Amino acid transporter n=1 Tax=Kaistia dalseonensis TaxID=410840 RepID=A0ABU0H630_9HYPH|nr:amino acid transporter [Kaistia dalseonensis]MCX5495182.1 amino acid transporter [Kaistia dalseonensis]MDQ0437767.1 hypothetical protein [Kaistia dalseonensis]
MNKLVQNEQRKLTASFLNGIAIALFAVGGLAQILSAFYATNPGHPDRLIVVSISLIFIGVSAGAHQLARRVLKGLIE